VRGVRVHHATRIRRAEHALEAAGPSSGNINLRLLVVLFPAGANGSIRPAASSRPCAEQGEVALDVSIQQALVGVRLRSESLARSSASLRLWRIPSRFFGGWCVMLSSGCSDHIRWRYSVVALLEYRMRHFVEGHESSVKRSCAVCRCANKRAPRPTPVSIHLSAAKVSVLAVAAMSASSR